MFPQAMHHPFTAPSANYLEGRCDAREATALAYDLVYNGCEIGGALLALHMQICHSRCPHKQRYYLHCFVGGRLDC